MQAAVHGDAGWMRGCRMDVCLPPACVPVAEQGLQVLVPTMVGTSIEQKHPKTQLGSGFLLS